MELKKPSPDQVADFRADMNKLYTLKTRSWLFEQTEYISSLELYWAVFFRTFGIKNVYCPYEHHYDFIINPQAKMPLYCQLKPRDAIKSHSRILDYYPKPGLVLVYGIPGFSTEWRIYLGIQQVCFKICYTKFCQGVSPFLGLIVDNEISRKELINCFKQSNAKVFEYQKVGHIKEIFPKPPTQA